MSAAAVDAPLAPLTTLRLGGPARRLVDVDTEAELVEAVRGRRRRAAAAAGRRRNLVIADEGFDGLVVRIAHPRRRRVEDGDGASVGRGGRALGRARRAPRSPTGWPASSACPASPARSARRRSRTSAPTARRSPRRSRSVRVLRPRAGAVARPGRRRVRLRLPHERVQAHAEPLRRARGDVPAARAPAVARRCATPSWRGRSASSSATGAPLARRARGGARAAPRQGHGARPRRPRHVSAGSFFTNPILDRRRAARRSSPAARRRWPQPDGRVKPRPPG